METTENEKLGDFAPDEQDERKEYAWEQKFVGDWDVIEQGTEEALKQAKLTEQRQRRERLMERVSSVVRRGMIRFVYLIIDSSLNLGLHDPSLDAKRIEIVDNIVSDFIKEFFDQNPLSQLGLMLTRDGKGEKLSDFSGNHKTLIERFKSKLRPSGVASLQNSLQIAMMSLEQVPPYGSREVIIVYSSLNTTDPGDIFKTIDLLTQKNIQVSVIGLGAEVYICKELSRRTGGRYDIPLNERHFRDALFFHASPPPVNAKKKLDASMIRMGFPQRRSDALVSFCVCHKEIRKGGYICPQCNSKYCELPTDCIVCGLSLVSSPHLARSYHHLFPVPPFEEITDDLDEKIKVFCYGCMKHLPKEASLRLKCPRCKNIYCIDCDSFIHESLHNCPGCEK